MPYKPECGSIEMNTMLRAINDDEVNPYPDSKACTAYWESITAQKADVGGICHFSLGEPDEYEDYLLDQIIPD